MYIDHEREHHNTDRRIEPFADKGLRSRLISETGPEAAVLTDSKNYFCLKLKSVLCVSFVGENEIEIKLAWCVLFYFYFILITTRFLSDALRSDSISGRCYICGSPK